MPRYNFKCSKECNLTNLMHNIEKVDKSLLFFIDSQKDHEQTFVWEVSRSMKDESDIFCPICNAVAHQTFDNSDSVPYIIRKGAVYEDRLVNKLHMDKALLHENDPYARWREPGEVEDRSKFMDKKIRQFGGLKNVESLYGVNKNIISLTIKSFIEWYNGQTENQD